MPSSMRCALPSTRSVLPQARRRHSSPPFFNQLTKSRSRCLARTGHLCVATLYYWRYVRGMATALRDRLQQQEFASPFQEATLNILVCADFLQRRIETVCEQHGITSAQYNVLRILRGVHPDGHARCDIIARMIQTAPDVTRLIDRLVNSGLVKRTRSMEDGRLSVTIITSKGLSLLSSMQNEVDALDHELKKRMTQADARTLSALCEKVYGE
ncbi:MAG: MarR family transcriptional regulator [Candidatus Kapabacteria bacterium]|nr:MarR family transcriptional regulator [Candidatus Kapabacteria bacterium]